jgi:hypothetical protein
MALSEMLLGDDGDQTIAEKKVLKIEFLGGDEVQCIDTGQIGHISRYCHSGVRKDERFVYWSATEGSVLHVDKLRFLKKAW